MAELGLELLREADLKPTIVDVHSFALQNCFEELAGGPSDEVVGLLNIGVEDIKGNEIVKEASRLMRDSNLNFKGYVEGDAIYTGDVDVIVCDGGSVVSS